MTEAEELELLELEAKASQPAAPAVSKALTQAEELEMLEAKAAQPEPLKAPGERDYGTVPADRQYQEGTGVVGNLIEAVDYLGNVSRSGIEAFEKDEPVLQAMGEAWDKKRYTSETNARDTARALRATQPRGPLSPVSDALLKKYGVDGDDKIQAGDWLDVGLDVALGIGSDPVTTLVGTPLKAGAKALGLLKPASKAAQAASLYGKSPAMLRAIDKAAPGGAAAKALGAHQVAGVAGGAVGGYAATDAEADLGTKLLGAAAGAGAVAGIKSNAVRTKAGGLLKNAGDGLYDKFHKSPGLSAKIEANIQTQHYLDAVVHDRVQEHLKIMKGAGKDRRRVTELMQGRLSELVEKRNEALKTPRVIGTDLDGAPQYGKSVVDLDAEIAALRASKLSSMAMKKTKNEITRQINGLSRERNVLFNNITEEITREMDGDVWRAGEGWDMSSAKYGDGWIEKIQQTEKAHVAKAIDQWVDSNLKWTARVNREAHGLMDGKWDPTTGRGQVGLKWHVDNVQAKKEMEAVEGIVGNMGKTWRKIATTRGDAGEKIMANTPWYKRPFTNADDQTFRVYADMSVRSLMRPHEAKIAQEIAAFNASKDPNILLRGFDALTNLSKTNMLMASLTWVKNNLFENMSKAYVEGGIGAAAGAVPGLGQLLQPKIAADMFAGGLFKDSYVYKHPATSWMKKHKVISSNFFKDQIQGGARNYYVSPKTQRKMERAGRSLPERAIGKTMDLWTGMLNGTTGTIGGAIEDQGRASLFLRSVDELQKIPGIQQMVGKKPEALYQIAKDIVDRTYIDYESVTAFEKAFMKRLVPFYTFYSRNLPYWLDAATSPATYGRIKNKERLYRQAGRAPIQDVENTNNDETKMLSPWDKDNNPRVNAVYEDGGMRTVSFPQDSFYDAARNLNLKESAYSWLEKANPLLKYVYEQGPNDGVSTFDNQPINPERSAKVKRKKGVIVDVEPGHRSLGAAGWTGYYGEQALDKLGVPKELQELMGLGGIRFTPSNKPVTESNTTSQAIHLRNAIFPLPVLNQIAQFAGNVNVRGKDWKDELTNMLISPSVKDVTPEEAEKNRIANYMRSRK